MHVLTGRTDAAGRAERKLVCLFVGQGEKPEKSALFFLPPGPADAARASWRKTSSWCNRSSRHTTILHKQGSTPSVLKLALDARCRFL